MAQQPPAIAGEVEAQPLNDWFSYLDSRFDETTQIITSDNKDYTVTVRHEYDDTIPLEYWVTTIHAKTGEAFTNAIKKGFSHDEWDSPNGGQDVDVYAREHNAIVATNASAGDPPYGYQIKDGVDYTTRPDLGHYDDLAVIYNDGTLGIIDDVTATTPQELINQGVKHSFMFGPYLIKDGVKYPAGDTTDLTTNNHPRQGIGQKSNGDYVIITVDGRSLRSQGIDVYGFADLFIAEGCENAYNLDGGGSAQTAIEGKHINNPADGVTRPRYDFLYFSYNVEPEKGILSEASKARGASFDLDSRFKNIQVGETYYNALNYLFVNDGLIDNTAQIEALSQKLSDAGGGTIYFPPGIYLFGKATAGSTGGNQQVNIVGNVRILGAGKNKTTFLRHPENESGILFSVEGNNVEFENLTIDGNAANNTYETGLITVRGRDFFVAQNVYFTNDTYRALTFLDICRYPKVIGCDFYNNKYEAIDFRDGRDVRINNNWFSSNSGGFCIGIAGSRFAITGNNIVNYTSALNLTDATDVAVTGNVMYNLSSRIVYGTTRHFNFTGNQAKDVGSNDAIELFDSANVLIGYIMIANNNVYSQGGTNLYNGPVNNVVTVVNNNTNLAT